MLVHFSTLVLFLTCIFGVINSGFKCYNGNCPDFYWNRVLFSISSSVLVALWGLKRKSIDKTGAVCGFFVGLILSYSSYCFFACLLTFFYTSSKATRFCSEKKRKFEADFKEGGQRTWVQVICNGGVAAEIAVLYLMEGGPGECLIHFDKNFVRSWLASSVLSVLAGVNGDTWASEFGTVLSKNEPRLITSLQKVPIGTNGGCTLNGLVFSALAGFIVGIAYFIALLFSDNLVNFREQAGFAIFIGTLGGILGSLLDSIIGATLQYSGLDIRSGKIVEHPGVGIQHISGRPILNNHSVNLIMSIINSILVPTVVMKLYSVLL